MKRSGMGTGMLLATLGVALMSTVARADEIEVGTPTTPTGPTVTEPSDMAGGPFKKGTLGVSVAVPGAAPSFVADLVYFVDKKSAVDLLLGFSLSKTPDVTDPVSMVTTAGSTSFGFGVGAGYRIYKKINDRLHTYVQPFALFSAASVDKIGDNLVITAGGNFGAEAFVTDWFSFRGQLGAAVQFAQKFEVINLATTTGLYANVYWK
ncbi:MAG: hypothetical protein NT062_29450 [Proteobacteria bacterium]|nr:hypothetical protein [Pseudomonadota bacterium]